MKHSVILLHSARMQHLYID